MSASIAASAHLIGLTPHQALWDYPVSAIMQMIHANGAMNGQEYDWTNAGDPSEDIQNEFARLSQMEIDNLIL